MTHRETAMLLAIHETLARFEAGPGEMLVLGLTLAGNIGVSMDLALPELTETLAKCYGRAEGHAAFERMRQAV